MKKEELKSFLERAIQEGVATIETPSPALVKEAISRYKDNSRTPGRLEFDSEPAGFHRISGAPLFSLVVYYFPLGKGRIYNK